jgi:hypothetical protein
MKLALIAKPGHLQYLPIGFGYHMALGQLLSNQDYADFYKYRHEDGAFIMVDNGAAEGGGFHFDQIVEMANRIGYDEIVLPDKLGDMKETVCMTLAAKELVIPKRRAICPQGESLEEWCECLRTFESSLEYRTICIPHRCSKFEGGRSTVLQYLQEQCYNQWYDVHLLGYRTEDEIREINERFSWVRGIDTAAPFAFAQHDAVLEGHGSIHFGYDFGSFYINEALIRSNIQTLWEVCNHAHQDN